MRRLSLAAALCLAGWSAAQTPDVELGVELRPTWTQVTGEKPTYRWYDHSGRHSLLELGMVLEPGLRVRVAQRFQSMPNDPDGDLIEEAYVERAGRWRVGKQRLPFGAGVLFRENALAVRFETRLIIDEAPASVAFVDGGSGMPNGLVARVGRRFGLSVAAGEHFGVSGSALSPIRSPGDSPGKGRGHRLVLGADYALPFGGGDLAGEVAILMDGETPADSSTTISDLIFVYQVNDVIGAEIGWARDWTTAIDFIRLEGDIKVHPAVSIRPYLRLIDGTWRDLSVSAVVKF